MKLLKILLILSLVQFYSCSKSQDQSEASDDPAGVEIADSGEEGGDEELDSTALDEEGDSVEVADASAADSEEADGESVAGSASTSGTDEVALDESAKSLEEVAPPADSADQTSGSEYVAENAAGTADAPAEEAPAVAASTDTSGIGDATYSVKSNETLMLIAFRLYGDYGKWKEIAALNQDKLNGSTLISPGMQLRYNTQGANFNWSPNGKEHVVKNGDTLSLISNQYYATIHKWKMIWENNKPLIKDPNKIFIGFTLFIPEDGMRDMASQPAPLAENSAPSTATAPMADEMAKGEAPAAAPAPAEDFPEDI